MELPALSRSKLFLVPLFLAIALSIASTETIAQAPSASPSPSPSPSPAPAPAPSYVNITQVLVSAGDFSTLVGLLGSSGVGEKFQTQANNTEVGITIFAPKDKAFKAEPAVSLLKGLSAQQLIGLLEYHALNNWQSLAALQQASDNVTTTFATYNAGGKYVLNVTNVKGQVEIITEWNRATTTSTLYNARPVSIFAIEQVLLPVDLFGLPAPAPAPSPSSGAPSPGAPSSSSSSSSSGSSASGPSANNSFASLSCPPPSLLSLLIISFFLFKLF